jgi:asparagine synthase (glutamine-hydrolysing)
MYVLSSSHAAPLATSAPPVSSAPLAQGAAALHGYLCFSHVPALSPPAPLSRFAGRGGGGGQIRTQLRAAITKRLTTQEVGVYLSGGLDSSLVAALLVEAGIKPHLFTLDFGAPFDAELPLARAVAAHLGLPITVVPARPRQILQFAGAAARAMPLPFGDGVTVPLYLLGKAARDYVPEIWNGEGGDQLFGGWANKPMIAALLYGSDGSEEAEVTEYMATYHRFWGLTDRLYTPALRIATADMDASEWVRPALDRAAHPTLLHRLRAANLALKGGQNIAPRMYALAECHGLRVCAPLFDEELAAWTFTLPPETLLAGACEKFLLKQVAESYLPPEIVWREKRGMGVPTTEWCMRPGALRWAIKRRLSPRRLRAQGWFQPELIQQLFRGEDPTAEGKFRRRRVGEKLWLLYMLELWCDAHGIREVQNIAEMKA